MPTVNRSPTSVPRSWVIGTLVAVVVLGAVLLTTVGHSGSSSPPPTTQATACGQLDTPLHQLATDLTFAIQQASKGPVPTTALRLDDRALQALATTNPGAFADHVQPVVDAVTQLIADMRQTPTNEPKDFIAIRDTTDKALSYCHISPSAS